MRKRLLLVLAVGCDAPVTVGAEDVVTNLEASPTMLTADGASTTVITVETVADEVKPGLKATLTVRGATWDGSQEASLERDVSPDGIETATLVASRRPGTATVVAEIAGYERHLTITFVEATPTDLTYTTDGRLEMGKASSIKISVQPLVPNGLPSTGTVVDFSLATTPAQTGYLTTGKAVLDATTATASTTVIAGTTTTSGSVEVRVTAPNGTSPAVTRTIPFHLLP